MNYEARMICGLLSFAKIMIAIKEVLLEIHLEMLPASSINQKKKLSRTSFTISSVFYFTFLIVFSNYPRKARFPHKFLTHLSKLKILAKCDNSHPGLKSFSNINIKKPTPYALFEC